MGSPVQPATAVPPIDPLGPVEGNDGGGLRAPLFRAHSSRKDRPLRDAIARVEALSRLLTTG